MTHVVLFHSILGLRHAGREIASTFGVPPMLTGHCIMKCCTGFELWYEPNLTSCCGMANVRFGDAGQKCE